MKTNKIKLHILNLPRIIKKGIVVILDVAICFISTWLAFGLRLDQWSFFYGNQWWVFILAVVFSLPIFTLFGLYRAIFSYVGRAALASIVRVLFFYAPLFFFIFAIFGVDDVPRSIGVIQPILFFIGIAASRYCVRFWLGDSKDNYKKSRPPKYIALICGAGLIGRQLAKSLARDNDMQVVGFIDDDPRLEGGTIDGILVYKSRSLEKLILRLNVTDILLAISSVEQTRRREIISSLNGLGVRVRTLSKIADISPNDAIGLDLYDLDLNDLLGRPVVPPKIDLLKKNIVNQSVLVTGAGGSIGSELCRQIIMYSPRSLVLVDNSEHSLYLIYEELKSIVSKLSVGDQVLCQKTTQIKLVPCLASVRDKVRLLGIFQDYQPTIVFHAAAYKHVPMVEQNPIEGICNNVFGTLTCAQVSLDCNVSQFILVSTDKAVRPTNIMGASKRIAELVLQAMAETATSNTSSTIFSMVRFGNVLGSSGSVTQRFRAQIEAGGPITVTHPEVNRYFMTIPEAAQLVIQASSMATGGEVFVLDMGEPVRIYNLALKMVYLSGLLVKDEAHPHGDIEIAITGLRPGEKLYEELLIGENPQLTLHPKIMKAHEEFFPWYVLQNEIEKLNTALTDRNI